MGEVEAKDLTAVLSAAFQENWMRDVTREDIDVAALSDEDVLDFWASLVNAAGASGRVDPRLCFSFACIQSLASRRLDLASESEREQVEADSELVLRRCVRQTF